MLSEMIWFVLFIQDPANTVDVFISNTPMNTFEEQAFGSFRRLLKIQNC